MDEMDEGRGRQRSPREWIGRRTEAAEGEPLRRSRGGGSDPLDQRVDRWVSAGRQFVEGVAGTRPGSRPASRPSDRPGERGSPRRPRFDELGRWVENRLDWLLDDGDDWREPWQEPDRGAAVAAPSAPPARPSRRQGLEAVSRRGRSAAASAPEPVSDEDWPDEDSFTLPRWQRPAPAERTAPAPPTGFEARPDDGRGASEPALDATRGASRERRPLPRSSRRRP